MWRASSDKLGSSFKILVLPGQKSHAVTWKKLADIEYGIMFWWKKFHWPVLKVFLSHCSSALLSKVQSIISRKPISSYCAFTVFMPNCCSFTVFIQIFIPSICLERWLVQWILYILCDWLGNYFRFGLFTLLLKGHCHTIWLLYKWPEGVFASTEFQN